MKKQALKAIAMLMLIVTIAFVTAVISANAQTGLKLKANVPFEFIVGDHKLPAGEYIVNAISTQDAATGIMMRNADDSAHAVRLVNPKQGRASAARLVFHRYGNRYYLAEVWETTSLGRQLLRSRDEKAVARELVSNNSEPETVAIIASVR